MRTKKAREVLGMNIQIFGTKKCFDTKKVTIGYQPEVWKSWE